jgi:SAM-dependent methyltransferase
MWPTQGNLEAWERRFGPHDEEPGLPDPVRKRLSQVRGKHVLHVGAGTGRASAELVALGALVSGIDSSADALAIARERAPGAAFFQAELDALPLQLKRRRFAVVYAGEGTLARRPEVEVFMSAAAAALGKNGALIVYEAHPVAACVDPVGLRWRESYFAEGRWRLGHVAAATTAAGLSLRELEELPPPAHERGGRLDPRIPTHFLLVALNTQVGAGAGRSG